MAHAMYKIEKESKTVAVVFALTRGLHDLRINNKDITPLDPIKLNQIVLFHEIYSGRDIAAHARTQLPRSL